MNYLFLFLLLPTFTWAWVQVHLMDAYTPMNPIYPVAFEAYGVKNTSASFKTKDVKHTKIEYNEAAVSFFLSGKVAKKHFLTLEIGYTDMDLDWAKNPEFHEKNFRDGVATVLWKITPGNYWRWVFLGGVQGDLHRINLKNRAFYKYMGWGRWSRHPSIGFHIGALGQAGLNEEKTLPILGFDWTIDKWWKLNVIYPIDLSLEYNIKKELKWALTYRGFGGWYRSFHRVTKDNPNPDAIFSFYSSGLDLGLYFQSPKGKFGFFTGYNFGGWLLIKNKHGASGKYYKFQDAAYVGTNLEYVF